MAIQFARIEIVSRKDGKNACCKAAYNARTIIQDQQTGITYDFTKKGGNVYHAILLPEHADKKFKNPEILMNAVERHEKRKNSQLLKDVVIALPDEKELSLEDRIAITHEIVDEMAWVQNGLAVQIDIHRPHDGEQNWHAHVLLLTRRFTDDGKDLGAKATDLNPEFKNIKGGKGFIIPEEVIIHERAKEVINQYFAKIGLDKRVDAIGAIPQEHIGPNKMRSLVNNLVEYNEWRKAGNIEIKKDADWLIDNVTKYQAIFSRQDVAKMVEKELTSIRAEDVKIQKQLIEQVMLSTRLVPLYNQDGKGTEYFTTQEVRGEELRLLRIASFVQERMNYRTVHKLAEDIQNLDNASISNVQRESLSSILLTNQGVRILRGRAGTGKSRVLGIAYHLATNRGQNVIGLAPTHKAASELKSKGYQQCTTVKSFLFKLYNGRVNLPYNSLLVVDEAGMIGTSDYLELFKVARKYDCQVILAGDERQLASIERSGMFEVFADKFGSYILSDIERQKQPWGRQMAMCFANGNIVDGIKLLEKNNGLKFNSTLAESMNRLITDWHNSKFPVEERLIITVRNKEVDALNQNIRELLKEQKILTGLEYRRTSFDRQLGKKISEYFMAGDRIVFKTSNKELETKNGDFATLLSVSRDKFTAKTDNGQEIAFNPAEVSFKHGYASTVYKAQGASIKDVYVLHNLAGNSRSSYVEMTRYVEEIGLYANIATTRGVMGLVSQLARISDKSASIRFLTYEDLARYEQDKQQIQSTKLNSLTKSTILEKVGNHLRSIAINIADRLHSNSQYYQIPGNIEPKARVEEAQEQTEETLTTKLKTIKTKETITNNQTNESQKTVSEKRDFNDILKTTGAESIKKLVEPEVGELPTNLVTDEKIAKLTEPKTLGLVAPINAKNSTADNNKTQIKSIKSELGKLSDNKLLKEFQQQIKSLEKFTITEKVSTALQIYKEKGMESFMSYSNDTCSKAIQQKIINDLVTMQDKFNPNHDLGKVRFSDVVIHDFTGKSHTVPEDYLVAIGKDQQVMQYINPQSVIGKEIRHELQNAIEIKKNNGVAAKHAIR